MAGTTPETGGASQVAGARAKALNVIVQDDTFIAVRNNPPLADVSVPPAPIGALKDGSPNPFWKLLSSPKTTLHYIYLGIGALILLALILLVAIETRRLHIPSLLRGVAVLAFISLLLWSGNYIFGGELLIV